MARLLFFFLLGVVALGAGSYLVSTVRGRPFIHDTAGKVLVALTIAGLAFWLFGIGFLAR